MPLVRFLVFLPLPGSYRDNQPSAQRFVDGQRAPFARVYPERSTEHPSPDCRRGSLCPSLGFLSFCLCRGPTVITSLRPSVSSMGSEHPSPECIQWYIQPSADWFVDGQRAPFRWIQSETASTLRLTVVLETFAHRSRLQCPTGIRNFPLRILSPISEHPSPDCHRGKLCAPRSLFVCVRPCWGPAVLSSVSLMSSSLNSEHSSLEKIILEERAPFA